MDKKQGNEESRCHEGKKFGQFQFSNQLSGGQKPLLAKNASDDVTGLWSKKREQTKQREPLTLARLSYSFH